MTWPAFTFIAETFAPWVAAELDGLTGTLGADNIMGLTSTIGAYTPGSAACAAVSCFFSFYAGAVFSDTMIAPAYGDGGFAPELDGLTGTLGADSIVGGTAALGGFVSGVDLGSVTSCMFALPAAAVPNPTIFYRPPGKSKYKCANVWDWCLENDKRLWSSVDWSRRGCIPVKCWRLEDNPLHAIPEQGREFHKFGMIPLPLTFGVDTQILRFQVPTGYSGVVYGVLCKYTGGGYVNGSGDLLWRFRVNQRWIKSLQAVPTELGDYSGYAQLDEYFKLSSGQTVRAYGWVDPATGLVGGSMIAALQGWYFPSQFAR